MGFYQFTSTLKQIKKFISLTANRFYHSEKNNKMQYTISELRNLSVITNHKIIYDGYEFWWYSVKDKEFTLQCIKPFNNAREAKAHIIYWQLKYSEELSKKDNYLDKMLNELMIDVEIKNICKDKLLKSKAKIKQILFIKPNVTPIELSKLLEITTMAISKQLKSIHRIC